MLRNRIIYALLLISSTLLVYFEPNFITSIFFHTVVYLVVLSSAHLVYTYIKVRVNQTLDPVVVEHGHTSEYVCIIHNESYLPSSVIIVNFLFNSNMFKDQLKQQKFTLMGGTKKDFEYNLSFKYRGVYSVGIETIEIADILQIFKIKIRNAEPKNVTVLPKVTLLPDFDLTPKLESNIKAAYSVLARDANSLVDIRKFEQGDPIKHIHWKLSARHDELLIRNLEQSAQSSTLIFLDTHKGKCSFTENIMAEDKLMEALVSLVNQRLYKNHRVELNYYDFETKNISYTYKEDFRDFFTNIAKVLFRHSKNIRSFINDYFNSQQYKQSLWGKDIFIFTCHPSLISSKFTIQKLLGNQCSVHIVSCTFDQENTGSYRTRDGIYYYNLTPSSNLQDIFVRRVQ